MDGFPVGGLFNRGCYCFYQTYKVCVFSGSRILKSCKSSFESHIKIYSSPHLKHSFSFFRYIFLGKELKHLPEKYRKLVIAHESVHIRQLHSLDLLFMEILKHHFLVSSSYFHA